MHGTLFFDFYFNFDGWDSRAVNGKRRMCVDVCECRDVDGKKEGVGLLLKWPRPWFLIAVRSTWSFSSHVRPERCFVPVGTGPLNRPSTAHARDRYHRREAFYGLDATLRRHSGAVAVCTVSFSVFSDTLSCPAQVDRGQCLVVCFAGMLLLLLRLRLRLSMDTRYASLTSSQLQPARLSRGCNVEACVRARRRGRTRRTV